MKLILITAGLLIMAMTAMARPVAPNHGSMHPTPPCSRHNINCGGDNDGGLHGGGGRIE